MSGGQRILRLIAQIGDLDEMMLQSGAAGKALAQTDLLFFNGFGPEAVFDAEFQHL